MRNWVLSSAAAAALVAAVMGAPLGQPANANDRDTIRVTGSSTVFPFATLVAEDFAQRTGLTTPVIESTGSGGGIAAFCAGIGLSTPDIANASRRMKASEFQLCQDNDVTDIIEVKIGFDGIVVAIAKDSPFLDFDDALRLTKREIYLALAKELPTSDDDCTPVANPNLVWSDVNPDLPDLDIEAYGPGPTSGTRDAFVEIVMEDGAMSFACLAELAETDETAFIQRAHTVREDQLWIDSGENDNAIVGTLRRNSGAVGVFGYSFLDQNRDELVGAEIDGAAPTFENIASGEYGVSRSMYFYMKKAHVELVPGMQEYAATFVSDAAAGPFGYLVDKGLIPLAAEMRAANQARVAALEVMEGVE